MAKMKKKSQFNQQLIDNPCKVCYNMYVEGSWEVQPRFKAKKFMKGGGLNVYEKRLRIFYPRLKGDSRSINRA